MDARQMLLYLDQQTEVIEALVGQLDEIQVAFNAQFDDFKGQHDAKLDELTDQIYDRLDPGTAAANGTLASGLRAAIDERLPQERQQIEERRQIVRQEYLPLRQQAADETLALAQAQLAEMRALNPELDEREEELKAEKAGLETRLVELNEEIGRKSRGFGVMRHFSSILRADQERQRIIGRLDVINPTLGKVRHDWERKRIQIEADQEEYQERWQLESIAVARLQSELDQLDDEARREALAQRRAITHVLDEIKEPLPGSDPELGAGLDWMIDLNIQTDTYHEALASVGGLIGLLRGVKSGLGAIHKSVEGLQREQLMHSDYLPDLKFSISAEVEAFNKQWPALTEQFADEEAHGLDPAGFKTATQPLLDGPLGQPNIEAIFNSLGASIEQATDRWG